MLEKMMAVWRLFDRPMKFQASGLAVMILVTGLLEAGGISMIFPVFQLFGAPENIQNNRWLAFAHEILGHPGYPTFLTIMCVGLFLYFVLKNTVVMANVYLQSSFVWKNHHLMATRLLECYLKIPYAYHLRRNSADFIRNVTVSIDFFFSGTIIPVVMLVAEVITALFIATVLFIAEPVAATVITSLLTGAMFFLILRTRRVLAAWGKEGHENYREILTTLHHTFGPIKEIKVLGRERNFLDRFRTLDLKHSSINLKNAVLREMSRPIFEILAVGCMIAVVLSIIMQGRVFVDIVPLLGIFGAAAFRLMPSANRMVNLINAIAFNQAAAAQIEADMKEYDRWQLPPPPTGRKDGLAKSLVIENISYGYSARGGDGEPDALAVNSVTLTVEKGQSIALVGKSGAGKSTMVNLILGLLQPDSGRILVDGREITPGADNWQERIGFVPQDIFIMDASIRNNIAFGLPDDKIDPERIRAAVGLAQLDALIGALPQGLDTFVGERGIRLSGGERQRLAIARALYSNPDVLVLDEATSSLDGETEYEITNAINRLHGDKTLIIIAHRLSTVRNCDRVYWMEAGRIVASGTFSELYQKNDDFRALVEYMNLSTATLGKSPAPQEKSS